MASARPDGRLVDQDDPDALRAAVAGAALVVVETVSNPHLAVADIPAVAAIAHAAGARLVVDNTIATPIGCRPLEHGADLVFHSATKYLNGHSDVLAGVAAGPAELVDRLAERSLELGATLAPDSAWLVRRGIRTLHLRLERASANAAAIAAFLDGHPRVRRVAYPGLASHPSHAVACRLLSCFGGLLTFEVEGGRPAGEAVMDRVTLCVRATSLGGVETCISHPASTSHRQLTPAQLEEAGIAAGDLRLTVGCEDVSDLIADLEQALR
jgi:cystathionine beta-lyase/cystathionine gamma-synthase